MDNGWHGEWVCTATDLERIEGHDLRLMQEEGCAWLVKDTRRDFGVALAEIWTGQPHTRAIYCREYLIFLESGFWWRVPHVRVRLVYDRRGMSKMKMSKEDFDALWGTFFPGRNPDRTVMVRGLESMLHDSDPDAGLELRPEVAERLRKSADLPESAMIPAEEVRRRLGL